MLKRKMQQWAYRSDLFFYPYLAVKKIADIVRLRLRSDEYYLKKKYKNTFGKELDLDNPVTLNEKMMWLMLNERKPFHTVVADKYAAREWLASRYGSEYLVPLDLVTTNYKDLTPEKLPDHSFIIKSNHFGGDGVIVRDKSQVTDWREIQMKFRMSLNLSYYLLCKEWQYKNIPRKIIVEKLLTTSEGRIPNDYKLNCINGKVEFIYVSVDREGCNKRNIYSRDWTPLPFTWANKKKKLDGLRGDEIAPPSTLSKMIEIAEDIARYFKLVRVDFYDVDGQLYYGEITLHHGNGVDVFTPSEYDVKYGRLLKLYRQIEDPQ